MDQLGELEVEALHEGLLDPELRRNPAFLEKVRKFLQQNELKTTPETKGVRQIQKETVAIPDFDFSAGTEVQ